MKGDGRGEMMMRPGEKIRRDEKTMGARDKGDEARWQGLRQRSSQEYGKNAKSAEANTAVFQ